MGEVIRFIPKSDRERARLIEKPERYTTASFRRLIPSTSSGTRHPQAICASAHTSIAARGVLS